MYLKELCIFKNGKGLKITNYGLYNIYGSTGIIGKTNNILINSPCCLIARVGANCGYVQYVNESCWITDNTIICTSREKTNIKYIYYLLQSLDINSKRIGSTQPLITSKILNDIEIVSHTLEEQVRIVNTISLTSISQ